MEGRELSNKNEIAAFERKIKRLDEEINKQKELNSELQKLLD